MDLICLHVKNGNKQYDKRNGFTMDKRKRNVPNKSEEGSVIRNM